MMKVQKWMIGIWLGMLLLAGGIASAEVITFQQGIDGYTSMVDTYVKQEFPDTNYSTNGKLQMGKAGDLYSVSLVRYDGIFGAGGIPDGVTITSATLKLWNCYADKPAWAIAARVYDVTTAWVAGEVTYNQSASGVPWAGINGIFSNFGTRYNAVGYTGQPLIYDVTAIVQQWQTTGVNYGFGLYTKDTCDAPYWSSECGAYTIGPLLTVEYTPEPATMLLLAGGSVLALLRRKKA
jgi:hypothetical protein